ncbi:hypothetical protein SprV_0401674800 [Sparganum proliferum]
MNAPLILWFLLLPCIAAWRLHPPGKTLVLPCPVAPENTTGNVSWFRDGQPTLFSTSESSSLVIKDPWYTGSGNYTCCYAISNGTGNAECFSSYLVFADKTELPSNLLRDTLPQPGETPIFKGITYWQPAMLLSFRPANFFKRTNFYCLYFIRTTTRIPKIEWFFLHSNSELSHNITTEELPCPPELLDGLHGIYGEDDFYGIRNRCFRSVLTLHYRTLGQDGDLGEGEVSTCVSDTLNAAHNLSRRDLANRLNACPKNALLLSWLSSNSICTGQAVELNCAWPAWQEISTNYLRMYSLSDFQTDAQLVDWVRNISYQDSGGNWSSGVLLFDADRTEVIVRGKIAYIHKNTISRRLKFDTVREELFACVRGSRFQLSFLEVLKCEHTSRYAPAIKLLLAAACTCGILTSIVVLLICFRKRGQLSRRVLKKMRSRASGATFSGDVATAASTATREEDGTAGDRTRLKQVFQTGLRLPLLRPLHQLSLHERINRLTDVGFFPARRVQIGNLLYGGCHSRVYSGFVSTVHFVDDASAPDNGVVLKTLPGRTCSANTLDQFTNEAVLLNRVGRHPNIVRMLRMVKHSRLEGLPLIVLECVDGPNLLEYLHSKLADAGTSVSGSTISLIHYDVVGPLFRADLFSMAVDVANAMAHLTSFRISHGDLAARNVILAGDFTAKLCDFGLARSYDDSPEDKVSVDRLPIRWSAPELLANPPVWHPKSDVWSFGVLLWEIFSLGSTPYPTCATEEAVADRVLSGWRLTAPTFVPRQLESLFSHLLSSCWGAVGQPDSRPPFSELLLFLRQLLVLLKSPPAHASDAASTTIFAAYEDIQEGQLVVLFLLHRKLKVREDGVEMFLECQHLIPFDDDEGIIHIPCPELRTASAMNPDIGELLHDSSTVVAEDVHCVLH